MIHRPGFNLESTKARQPKSVQDIVCSQEVLQTSRGSPKFKFALQYFIYTEHILSDMFGQNGLNNCVGVFISM